MTTARRLRQPARFALIGGAGFVVDGGILTLLNSLAGMGLAASRFWSFGAAVTLTWLLNRRYTFAERRSTARVAEWTRYALVNAVGALLNLGIFLVLVYRSAFFARFPLIPLAIAASVALVFNFTASRQVAFRP